jgi:hypothetical protein
MCGDYSAVDFGVMAFGPAMGTRFGGIPTIYERNEHICKKCHERMPESIRTPFVISMGRCLKNGQAEPVSK